MPFQIHIRERQTATKRQLKFSYFEKAKKFEKKSYHLFKVPSNVRKKKIFITFLAFSEYLHFIWKKSKVETILNFSSFLVGKRP